MENVKGESKFVTKKEFVRENSFIFWFVLSMGFLLILIVVYNWFLDDELRDLKMISIIMMVMLIILALKGI